MVPAVPAAAPALLSILSIACVPFGLSPSPSLPFVLSFQLPSLCPTIFDVFPIMFIYNLLVFIAGVWL